MRFVLPAIAAFLLLAAPAAAQSVPARVQGDRLVLGDGGGPAFWAGLNLGVTVPGHAPGELAPSRRDYDRWLDGIGALGARVVRVYTILRPAFYDALAAYNRRHASKPLHFIQGVWIPEEELLATGNAYAPEVTNGFDRELTDAVAVVHGDATLRARRGHASGRYRADVSRWLLAWSPGIEWDPGAVATTNQRNAGVPPHTGRFISSTADANPMETWIAARLDRLAALEADRGVSRPLTFTNWITTDPLEHPLEPFHDEDSVSIDALHIQATPQWPGGFFASYHAYPYYPDFLRLEYAASADPYAAYLQQLRAHHAGQAVMVTEFGVPSGLGAAHRGPLGRDHGDHSEQEAGRIDASLLSAIKRSGFAGGLLFEYTDEWFKRSWNTQDLAQPVDRRPLWHNVLTNETQFGIVATEPGKRSLVTLDGRTREWKSRRVTHDAAYLYLRTRGSGRIGIDVRPGGGDEVRITLGPGRKAHIEQSFDPTPDVFGVEARPGKWHSPRLIVDRGFTVPGTGQQYPPEFLDLGTLRWGSERADARNLVAGSGREVEIRIPWMLLGFADPSARLVYNTQPGGKVSTRRVSGVKVRMGGRTSSYRWKTWNSVEWHERRKAGWPAVRRAFRSAQSG
jgi:hypothetical protein